jgi:hypothetical protein
MKMRKIFDLSKRNGTDREAAVALAKSERALTDSELDQVAAAGGKTGASSNPIDS